MEALELQRIREENIKISRFIKSWQLKNDILNFSRLEDFNAKFKKDFNSFIEANDFHKDNIELFKIK